MSAPLLGLRPQDRGLSQPLCDDIHRMDTLLGVVLENAEGKDFVALFQSWVTSRDRTALHETTPLATLGKCARALTLVFQLLNVLEQKEIVRVNRARRREGERSRSRETLRGTIHSLKQGGTTAKELEQALAKIYIEPTLTAHPTEAKRRAVLDKLHRFALAMEAPDQGSLQTPLDDQSTSDDLRDILTELWLTEEMRDRPLMVEEEVENALYFLEGSIFDVAAWIRKGLRDALQSEFPDQAWPAPPIIAYRSWIGGDRDGNPKVTPEVTRAALYAYHRACVARLAQAFEQSAQRMTMSEEMVPPSPELMERLRELEAMVPLETEVTSRYAREPYALMFVTMARRLWARVRELDGLPPRATPYQDESELVQDLQTLSASLAHCPNAPHHVVDMLIWRVETFGLRYVSLDIRQHSEAHEKALDEIFQAAGVTPKYGDLSEEEKIALLRQEIQNPRPLVPESWTGSEATERVRQVYRVVKKARSELGPQAVRTTIVSMTHALSDWLEPVLLAKEAGLTPWGADALAYVPLFETVDDLEAGAGLLTDWLDLPEVQSHLQANGNTQEIMLGYSDSSKDGGYLAANWALHKSQAAIANAGKAKNTEITFFHGRGGTVGRGGGRASQAILSQPSGSFAGPIRFTEQGEVISFRYGLPALAERHLEQIVGATLQAQFHLAPEATPEDQQAVDALAGRSKDAFRAFIYDNPNFWTFYIHATPIRLISLLPIASRPVSRSSDQLVGLGDLRAIPWNFAWVQNRVLVTGWYGIGAAYDQATDSEKAQYKRLYLDWPFFRTVLDNAQLELVRTHMSVAELYFSRAEARGADPSAAQRLRDEYAATIRAIQEITGSDELMPNARTIRKTVDFRNPLTEPLHALQLALMDRFDDGDQSDPALRAALAQTLAGLAAAMQSTG
jgi:phosphoenolpyruvate carboxylase